MAGHVLHELPLIHLVRGGQQWMVDFGLHALTLSHMVSELGKKCVIFHMFIDRSLQKTSIEK
mgnify:CR=1 FL=1